MLDSGKAGQPFAHGAGAALADALDGLQVVDARGEQLLQSAEVIDQPVDDEAGQPRHLGQQAVAARADRRVERVRAGAEAQRPRDRAEVEQVGAAQRVELRQDVLDAALTSPARDGR